MRETFSLQKKSDHLVYKKIANERVHIKRKLNMCKQTYSVGSNVSVDTLSSNGPSTEASLECFWD
jgi:hypothetical protein